jgi:hypothetical protein
MDDTTPTRVRFYHITPGRFVTGLLAVDVFLWLSERFGWLAWHKGYAVLTALASIGVAMVLMLLWFAVALIFRQRFQFGIRSLMLMVVAVAVPLSWLAASIKDAKTQRSAVHAVEMAGGETWYDDGEHHCRVNGTSVQHDWATFDFFYPISGVDLHCADPCINWEDIIIREDLAVSPQLLVQVANLPHLHYLNLAGTDAGDACLEPLWKLHELARLDLRCTHVTEAGVATLMEKIPNVRISWGWNDVDYRRGSVGVDWSGGLYHAREEERRAIANEREIRILDLNLSFGGVPDAEMQNLNQLQNHPLTCPPPVLDALQSLTTMTRPLPACLAGERVLLAS